LFTRWPLVNVTNKTKQKKTAEKADKYLPYDETAFHPLKQSGKSGIRRGIPLRPKKCCGKKVMFTPINVVKK